MTTNITNTTWQTINWQDLETVSGGKKDGTSSDVSASLEGIKSSIASLSDNKKSSGGFNDPMTMCLFALCMSKNSGPSNTTVVAGAAPASSSSWSFRSSVRW